MVKGIKVEITLRDNDTGDYLVIPVVPPKIPYQEGDPLKNGAKILNLGNINFPDGVDLDRIAWNSFFPARYDPGYCATSNLLDPQSYRNRIRNWKDNSTALQLIIPAAGINKSMKVDGFSWDFKGFEGDIYYRLSLEEYKQIRPKKVRMGQATVPAAAKKQPEDRPSPPKKPQPKTYTVKSGDTLSLIGKKVGVNWRTIYNNNKSVIGSNPNLIKPGQVYKV